MSYPQNQQNQQNPQGPTRQQFEQLLKMQRQQQRRTGCLMALVWTWLFGIFYWSWLGVKWTAILSWRGLLLSWRWTVALSRWSWRGGVALSQLTIAGVRRASPVAARTARQLQARYGTQRLAIAAGAVAGALVIVVIVGALVTSR